MTCHFLIDQFSDIIAMHYLFSFFFHHDIDILTLRFEVRCDAVCEEEGENRCEMTRFYS